MDKKLNYEYHIGAAQRQIQYLKTDTCKIEQEYLGKNIKNQRFNQMYLKTK